MHINLQELAINKLNLTNLQLTTLNGIGAAIYNETEDYFSVCDALSEDEDTYLRAWLENNGIVALPKEGVLMRGATAQKWLEEHSKAEG